MFPSLLDSIKSTTVLISVQIKFRIPPQSNLYIQYIDLNITIIFESSHQLRPEASAEPPKSFKVFLIARRQMGGQRRSLEVLKFTQEQCSTQCPANSLTVAQILTKLLTHGPHLP